MNSVVGSLGSTFHSRAFTSGRAREAPRFNRLLGEFEPLGALVIGVSVDPGGAAEEVCREAWPAFMLLSDPEGRWLRLMACCGMGLGGRAHVM